MEWRPAYGVAQGMRIDVWSDVVCPWCYLGKRRLERALDRLGWADEVTVRWRAYQLDPRATDQPKDLRRAIEAKYGPGSFDGLARRLSALGAPEGIDYRWDRAVRVSTLDAHRLLAWAWASGGARAQGPLKERLLRAYFTEGANVADHDTLTGLAADAGLDPDAARGALAGDAHLDEVRADVEVAADRDIMGVPAFVIEDRLVIPGAQEVETFEAVLTRARDRLVPALTPAAEVCDVDDPRC